MKISEVAIQRYCDFCSPQVKKKAIASCGVCRSDVCDSHRNLIPVLKASPSRQPMAQLGAMPLLLRYNFVAICPDCSFQSFFSLMESLSKRTNYVTPEATKR